MMSMCVAQTELAKVYALVSSMDSLVPIGVSQIYALIFKVMIKNATLLIAE